MIDESERLPLAEIEKTKEYQRLTPKQRLFVASYCEGGLVDGNYDPVAATRTAYACKSAEVARIMSYSIMQNIRIIAVLNLHFHTAPIEDFLVLVDRAIRNKNLTNAQLQALRLKCDIMGFANRLPTENAPTGVIPKEVLDATEAVRKAKRKPPEKPSKPEPKLQWEPN